MVKKEIICVGLGLFGLSNMKSDPESRSKKRSVIDNKKRSHERILEVSILNGNWDQSIAHAISENTTKTDWVGIYGLNETPGKDSAYRFGYINENGIAVLNKGTDKLPKGEKLNPGEYIAYLFADDGYLRLDSQIINIPDNSPEILEVSILNGNWDQSIAHAISENSNKTDWVGIYGLNETPGKDSAYRFGYINENGIAVLNKGTDKLPKGEKLIPGKYIAYLFADDSYQILDSKIIFI